MSEDTPTNPSMPPEEGSPETNESGAPSTGGLPTESGRATSVRFRTDADVRDKARAAMRMDSANEAMADALKITFRLVQFGMAVLVFLYLFSGTRMIQEGESGLKVRFGRIQDSNLSKGPHWALPNPIGEIVPIGAGSLEIRLETNKEFFPYVSSEKWNEAESKLSKKNDLDPAEDGSLITADLNIAHSQWTVNYRRTDHVEYATNVIPSQERDLVRLAAMTGVVHAVAQTTIDDLLKDRDTVASEARRVAQRVLEEMQTGITIEQMSLNRKFAPAALLDKFAEVQSAQQTAGQKREEARTAAQDQLNRVAGLGANHLIDMIDQYEAQIELGDQAEADRLLARIDAVLAGDPVVVDGQTLEVRVTGKVSQILADARNDAFQRVSDARGSLELFQAKQEQYDANPRLMVMREWSSGMRAFHDRPFVQSFLARKGGTEDLLRILINEDPDIRRGLEKAQQLQQAENADATREEIRQKARDDYDAKAGN